MAHIQSVAKSGQTVTSITIEGADGWSASTADNYLWALICTRARKTVTLPSGWTQGFIKDDPAQSSHPQIIFAYREAAPSTSSLTFSWTGGIDATVHLFEFSGMVASMLDQTTGGNGQNTSPSSGTTGTTTQANEVIVGCICSVNDSTDHTSYSPADYTIRFNSQTRAGADDGNSIRSTTQDKTVSSTGTHSLGATLATTRRWTAIVVTLKAAAAGITAAGIASAEAHGQPTVSANVTSAGIASAEALGSPSVSASIVASGIASQEAFGSPSLSAGITSAGIPSAEAFGSASVSAGIEAAGIASQEAFGLPVVAPSGVVAAGIESAEAFGSPTVEARIDATGVDSAEAIGGVGVGANIAPAGISSVEALGSPSISAGISASGISSTEAIGQPSISAGITSVGIASQETFGEPTVGAPEVIGAGGIESGEAFGNPTVGQQRRVIISVGRPKGRREGLLEEEEELLLILRTWLQSKKVA